MDRVDRPAPAEPWNRMGAALAGGGDWGGAQTCFEAALAADPRRPELWANLALAAGRAGDAATSEGALEMALCLAPHRGAEWRAALADGRPATRSFYERRGWKPDAATKAYESGTTAVRYRVTLC